MDIYTVGHSTHPADDFIGLLRAHDVDYVADIRSIPRSRHNPQFNSQAIGRSLAEQGLGHAWFESLGGLRHPNKDSINGAWRNASFRGYEIGRASCRGIVAHNWHTQVVLILDYVQLCIQ